MKFSTLVLLPITYTAAAVLPPIGYAVPLPSQDPFYAPPVGYQVASPGDILRIREAPGNITSIFTNASQVYDILFRSTDSNYQPTWGFTTFFIPNSPSTAPVNASQQILSYQIPYDSADVDAGPTTQLYGSPAEQGLQYTDVQNALSKGWYVNVPDFEGPYASFVCEVQQGHATLDSIRAVLKSNLTADLPVHTSSSPRVALWGYSGGSVASEVALELQVQYAPDLASTLVGAALGGIVPNISNALLNLSPPSFGNGLVPALLVGFSTQHPDVHDYLISQLKPSGPIYNATNFFAVQNMSSAEYAIYYENQDMFNYFISGRDFYTSTVLQTAFARDATWTVHGVPQVPLYIYKAIHDEVSNVTDADSFVDYECGYSGTNILYERNTVGGHVAEEINGDGRALSWLEGVLSGTYTHTGCTTRNVTVAITDSPE